MSSLPWSGHLSRRALLRFSSIGLGSHGLAELLRQDAQGAPPAATRVRSVILLQHYGAPSHIDLWDPKPDAPAEIRGEFKTIPTSLTRYRVTEVMPRLARHCHTLALVRSMTHRTANHNPATYLSITGHAPQRDVVQVGTTLTDWPAYGSALVHFLPRHSSLPPFVQIPHVA